MNMKKFYFVLTGFILSINILNAQDFSFDFGAGAIYPVFSELPFDYKAKIGPQAFVRAWYNINDDLSIGIEANYLKIDHNNESDAYLKSSYLGLPILIKRTFLSQIYVSAGIGYAGWVSFSDRPIKQIKGGINIPADDSDITGFIYLPAILGYHITDGIFIEARSLWGLSKMSKTYEYTVSPVGLGIGFRL